MIISKKQLIGVVAIGILLAGVVFFIWWVSKGRFIQTTDDAYIGGNITTVASKVSGYISAIEVRDNQSVKMAILSCVSMIGIIVQMSPGLRQK